MEARAPPGAAAAPRAAYAPDPALRDARVTVAAAAALLFVDVQNYNCRREGALHAGPAPPRGTAAERDHFFGAVAAAAPRWAALAAAARAARVEVLYTVIQSLTADGRDRGLDYKATGFHVPPGSWDARVLDEVAPRADEIVFAKTSSSVFRSTNILYVLRNMGVSHLVLAGCATDQCVDHAARDACDEGLAVTLVHDACCTYSAARHAAALAAVGGYCRVASAADVLAELRALAGPE